MKIEKHVMEALLTRFLKQTNGKSFTVTDVINFIRKNRYSLERAGFPVEVIWCYYHSKYLEKGFEQLVDHDLLSRVYVSSKRVHGSITEAVYTVK